MAATALSQFRDNQERAQSQLDKTSASFQELMAWSEATITRLEKEVRDLQSKNFISGLNHPTYRDAICAHALAQQNSWALGPIATYGSGPWAADDFQRFLSSRGFELVLS